MNKYRGKRGYERIRPGEFTKGLDVWIGLHGEREHYIATGQGDNYLPVEEYRERKKMCAQANNPKLPQAERAALYAKGKGLHLSLGELSHG